MRVTVIGWDVNAFACAARCLALGHEVMLISSRRVDAVELATQQYPGQWLAREGGPFAELVRWCLEQTKVGHEPFTKYKLSTQYLIGDRLVGLRETIEATTRASRLVMDLKHSARRHKTTQPLNANFGFCEPILTSRHKIEHFAPQDAAIALIRYVQRWGTIVVTPTFVINDDFTWVPGDSFDHDILVLAGRVGAIETGDFAGKLDKPPTVKARIFAVIDPLERFAGHTAVVCEEAKRVSAIIPFADQWLCWQYGERDIDGFKAEIKPIFGAGRPDGGLVTISQVDEVWGGLEYAPQHFLPENTIATGWGMVGDHELIDDSLSRVDTILGAR